MELTHNQPTVFAEPIDYWLEGIFAVALLVSIAVLASIARAGLSRRAALVGWTVAAACHGALLVAAAATTMDGRETLDALFAPGFLAIIADHATLARGRHPERLMRGGLVLLAGFAATVLVDDNLVAGAGGLVLAAPWAALSRLIATPDLVTTPMRPLVRGYGKRLILIGRNSGKQRRMPRRPQRGRRRLYISPPPALRTARETSRVPQLRGSERLVSRARHARPGRPAVVSG